MQPLEHAGRQEDMAPAWEGAIDLKSLEIVPEKSIQTLSKGFVDFNDTGVFIRVLKKMKVENVYVEI